MFWYATTVDIRDICFVYDNIVVISVLDFENEWDDQQRKMT